MRSRARFERFFVLTQKHLAYCWEQVRRLRARDAQPAGEIRGELRPGNREDDD